MQDSPPLTLCCPALPPQDYYRTLSQCRAILTAFSSGATLSDASARPLAAARRLDPCLPACSPTHSPPCMQLYIALVPGRLHATVHPTSARLPTPAPRMHPSVVDVYITKKASSTLAAALQVGTPVLTEDRWALRSFHAAACLSLAAIASSKLVRALPLGASKSVD